MLLVTPPFPPHLDFVFVRYVLRDIDIHFEKVDDSLKIFCQLDYFGAYLHARTTPAGVEIGHDQSLPSRQQQRFELVKISHRLNIVWLHHGDEWKL